MTASRTMAIPQLAGLSITTVDGVRVVFVEPDEDEEGPTGVREPHKPKKPSPADMSRRRRVDAATR